MNKIYRTIDEIHMDEEKKDELRANLVKEYEEMEGLHMRQKNKIALAWKTAAAMLGVVAVLGGSTAIAGAVFGFDVNRDFENYFRMSEKEDQKLHEEKVIQAPKISDTHNGFTVEAEKLISTEKECFVWLKITAPEDKWPLTNPVCFGTWREDERGYYFYQNGKEIEEGIEITYVYNGQEPGDSDEPWNTIVWQPEKGVTYQKINLSTAEGEESWDGSTLQIQLRYLNHNDEVIDSENVWNLEIPVEASNKAVEHKIQYTCPISDDLLLRDGLKEIVVTKVTVHPFAIGLEFQCPEPWKKDPDLAAMSLISGYECKDGSVVKFDTPKHTYNIVEMKENDMCEISEMYYEPMDVENITAVYLGGERIPLE